MCDEDEKVLRKKMIIEDERGVNRISENKCRNCGRIGCEGGSSCVNENGEC